MKDWIPLLQQLVWPLFCGALLYLLKVPLARLLGAIEERIASGAEFEAGPGGVKVGAAPKLPDIAKPVVASAAAHSLEGRSPDIPKPGALYLVHTARRDRSRDQSGQVYYRVRVYLDADDPAQLDDVTEVMYYLHETFKDPVRVVRDRTKAFDVQTSVWGEFNVAALVRFKDGHTLHLERYLNL